MKLERREGVHLISSLSRCLDACKRFRLPAPNLPFRLHLMPSMPRSSSSSKLHPEIVGIASQSDHAVAGPADKRPHLSAIDQLNSTPLLHGCWTFSSVSSPSPSLPPRHFLPPPPPSRSFFGESLPAGLSFFSSLVFQHYAPLFTSHTSTIPANVPTRVHSFYRQSESISQPFFWRLTHCVCWISSALRHLSDCLS